MSNSDRARSCGGKQNHADAILALMASVSVHQACGASLFPYKCRYCINWHLGHINPFVRAFIQALIDYTPAVNTPRLTHNLGDVIKRAVLTPLAGEGRDLRFNVRKIT